MIPVPDEDLAIAKEHTATGPQGAMRIIDIYQRRTGWTLTIGGYEEVVRTEYGLALYFAYGRRRYAIEITPEAHHLAVKRAISEFETVCGYKIPFLARSAEPTEG